MKVLFKNKKCIYKKLLCRDVEQKIEGGGQPLTVCVYKVDDDEMIENLWIF